jgi:hypothetical protein
MKLPRKTHRPPGRTLQMRSSARRSHRARMRRRIRGDVLAKEARLGSLEERDRLGVLGAAE